MQAVPQHKKSISAGENFVLDYISKFIISQEELI